MKSEFLKKRHAKKPIQKIASSRTERRLAFDLIYNAYLNRGLCKPNPNQILVTPHQLSSQCDIFVTLIEGDVAATISMVRDGSLGLPMDDIYQKQLEQWRAQNIQIAELCCLADRRQDPRRIIGNLCDLIGLVAQSAIKREIQGFVLVAHPRHAKVYKRFMGFEAFGPVQPYNKVQNKLAEPLWLDIANSAGNVLPSCRARIFRHLYSEAELEPQPISQPDIQYFKSKTIVEPLMVPSVLQKPPKIWTG